MAYLWRSTSFAVSPNTYYYAPSTSPESFPAGTVDPGPSLLVIGLSAANHNSPNPYALSVSGNSIDFFGNLQNGGINFVPPGADPTVPQSDVPPDLNTHVTAIALPSNLASLSSNGGNGGVAFFVDKESGTFHIKRSIVDLSSNSQPASYDDVATLSGPLAGYTPLDVTALAAGNNTYDVTFTIANFTNGHAEIDVQGYNAITLNPDGSIATATKANAAPTTIWSGTITSPSDIPQFQYRPGAGAYVLGIEKVDANNINHYIFLQGYSTSVVANTSLNGGAGIELNHDNALNITEITDLKLAQLGALNPNHSNSFVVADSEIRNGHNNVVLYEIGVSGATVITPTHDLNQTVSLQLMPVAGSPNDNNILIGYGDSTGGATFAEYDSNRNLIAGSTITLDSSNGLFEQVRSLGDGRAEATFVRTIDANTTQYVFDILDFRTSGVSKNDSAVATDVKLAGTMFNDAYTGGTGNNGIAGMAGNDALSHAVNGTASANSGAGALNTIDGGPGRDVLALNVGSGTGGFSMGQSGDGHWTITANDGGNIHFQDQVYNVEKLHLLDKDIALREPTRTDLNGDSTSDILWRNPTSGDVIFEQLQPGGTFGSWRSLGGSSTAWSVAGTGDFNGDGTSDILWRNPTSGDVLYEQLNNGGTFEGWHSISGSSTAWSIAGTGDFNGDGTTDILWRNGTSGDVIYEQMTAGTNGTLEGWHSISGSSTAWSIAGTGDFNGDSVTDILWRNNTTGDVIYEQMNGGTNGTLEGWHSLGGSATDWLVAGTGDFNNDGVTDVLWRNNTSGNLLVEQLQRSGLNATVEGWHSLGNVSTDYTVIGSNDYNSDGTSDVAFRSTTTGNVSVLQVLNSAANGPLQSISGSSLSFTTPTQ